MSAFDFTIEYRPGPKHGNADAMSRRCPYPHECRCPLLEDEEILKCGPCQKCKRRANLMDSNLMATEGTLKPNAVTRSQHEDPEDIQLLVQRCITGQPLLKRGSTNVHIRSAGADVTVIKKQRRLGRTGRQRRARRLSLPNLCRNAKYRCKLRSHSKTESNETSDKEIKVTQHEYWALPKMSELRARQLKDPDIAPLIKWKEEGK